jgi:predicted acetyltransferase
MPAPTSYLQALDKQSRGIDLPPNHVPYTSFWLVSDQRRLLGGSRLRHGLNSILREWGCHIGYDIRPGERRKGYGTLLLSLMLEKARDIGLTRVYLTCDAKNTGSIGVIRKNNGRFDDEYFLERVGVVVRRYAIQL